MSSVPGSPSPTAHSFPSGYDRAHEVVAEALLGTDLAYMSQESRDMARVLILGSLANAGLLASGSSDG